MGGRRCHTPALTSSPSPTPAEPIEPKLAAHLAICTICHAEVASLRHTVDLARATHPATDTGPPSRVWHAISGELAAPPRNPR